MPAKKSNINKLQYMEVTGFANLRLVMAQLPEKWGFFCIYLNLGFSKEPVCELPSWGGSSLPSSAFGTRELFQL